MNDIFEEKPTSVPEEAPAVPETPQPAEPVYTEPVCEEPPCAEPVYAEPVYSEPAPAEPIPNVRILTENPRKPKKAGKALGLVALALCFSLLGGILGGGAVLLWGPETATQTVGGTDTTDTDAGTDSSVMLQGNRENSVIEIVDVDTETLLTAAEVYAYNVQSTVGITTSITTNYWGYQSTSAASGSGFIVSTDGYIVTNFHVIEDSDSITVSLYNGDAHKAALIGYDENNDLAVLKIDATDLAPVVLGDSDNLNVGDSVVAIGNPLGELTFSLTSGSISAKDREVTMSSNLTMNLLQTDCAINSGNSGGALFNMYGEVIGITNAKYSSSGSETSIDNIGFAIPINDVIGMVKSMIEKGYYSKPYLGVSVSDVSKEYQYSLPQGAIIQSIADGSPAEEAGLQVGDIITAFNGTEITGRTKLSTAVERCQVGDTVTLTVYRYRQGETLEITVTIGEQIQSTDQGSSNNNSGSSGTYPWNRG